MDNQQDESEPCSGGLEVQHCLMQCFIASLWDGGQVGDTHTWPPPLTPGPDTRLLCSALFMPDHFLLFSLLGISSAPLFQLA